MKLSAEYKIDGVAMLVPDAGAELSSCDLDSPDSGRDESGFMHRIVVRSRVRTWKFSYEFLTRQEYRYMKNLLSGKTDFQFTFLEDGKVHSTRAYCSNDSIVYENATTGMYRNYKISVIEC